MPVYRSLPITISGTTLTISSSQVLFADGTAAAPSMSFSADPDTGVFRPGNNQLGVTLGGTVRMYLFDRELYIGNGYSNAAPAGGGIYGTRGSGTNIAGANFVVAGGVSTGTGAGGAVVFQTSPAGSSGSASNTLTERMRITSAGYVGIGTNAPGVRFVVQDDTSPPIQLIRNQAGDRGAILLDQPDSTDGNAYSLQYRTTTTGTGGAANTTLAGIQFTADTHDMPTRAGSIRFFTDKGGAGYTEKMRINADGQVLVGSGTAAAPVLSFASDTDTGMYRVDANRLAFATAGLTRAVFSGSSLFVGNGQTAASPTASAVRGTGGEGSNIAGANLTISGGNSTGSAAGGAVVFQTAPAGSAGSTDNTQTERARIKATGQLRFVPLAADPAGAEAGDVYYNSTSNKLKVYDGTSWVDLH